MLGMMVFIVSKMKQRIWKGFRSMEIDLESFGLSLKNRLCIMDDGFLKMMG